MGQSESEVAEPGEPPFRTRLEWAYAFASCMTKAGFEVVLDERVPTVLPHDGAEHDVNAYNAAHDQCLTRLGQPPYDKAQTPSYMREEGSEEDRQRATSDGYVAGTYFARWHPAQDVETIVSVIGGSAGGTLRDFLDGFIAGGQAEHERRATPEDDVVPFVVHWKDVDNEGRADTAQE